MSRRGRSVQIALPLALAAALAACGQPGSQHTVAMRPGDAHAMRLSDTPVAPTAGAAALAPHDPAAATRQWGVGGRTPSGRAPTSTTAAVRTAYPGATSSAQGPPSGVTTTIGTSRVPQALGPPTLCPPGPEGSRGTAIEFTGGYWLGEIPPIYPAAIAVGRDGTIWIAVTRSSRVIRIARDGTMTNVMLPGGQWPTKMVAGPDGNIWMATGGNWVTRVAPGGQATIFDLGIHVNDIIAGPDGNLWAAPYGPDTYVVRITVAGAPTVISLADHAPLHRDLGELAPGSDGNVWVGQGSDMVRITPAGVITRFPWKSWRPSSMTLGPDGAIWFVGTGDGIGTGFIGRTTMAGVTTCFSVPRGDIWDIAGGTDGIYFTTEMNQALGRVTPAGHAAWVAILWNASWMATGPDGRVWILAGQSVAAVD